MRSFLPALTLILLGASPCVISEVDQSVHWAGWVLTDMPSDEGNEVLQTGAVEITTPDGTSLGEADASTSSPGPRATGSTVPCSEWTRSTWTSPLAALLS